ncbi:hypothetical protein ACQ4LE_007458, partial [Meloidogyne hapla]
MFIILLPTRQRLSSFYLFFIILFIYFNLIIGSGQLKFQLTTFNSSEQFRVELCANEFRWRESSKSEWGKDCKFGRAEVFLSGNGTFDERQQTLISTSTTSISLPFSHFWRQSFTLELRLWHNNELLLQKTERIFPLPVGSGWRSFNSNFNLNKENNGRKLEILFKVDCLENYFGSGCDIYCKLNDLEIILDRMECNNKNGLKKCKKGWNGNNCNQKVLLNENNNKSICYCINDGKCVDNKCVCPVGYWGNNCEKCIPNSRCKGFCRQRPGECSCPEGKGGQFCEKDLIFCSKNSPCQNGGICQNNAEGNYTCKCKPGYGGINCERQLNNCEEEPCYNGAKCINLFSSPGFRCECPPSLGLYGRFCEIKAPNGCKDLPCQNGGSCADFNLKNNSNTSFKCLCPDGWTGHFCEQPWGRCTENPCQNGGSCITDNFNINGYVCLCPIGWSGINCENKINNCLINPCLNGGNCLNLINSFRCYCNEEWEGDICQNKIKRNKKFKDDEINKSDCIKCSSSKQQNTNNLLNIISLLLALIALLLAFLSLFCFILRFLPFQLFKF